MKVLLLTNRVPFPPNGGYPIVVYNTIAGLLELGADITVFSLNISKHFVDVDDINDPIVHKIKFYSAQVDTEVNVWSAFKNLFTDDSYNVSRYYTNDCALMLENILREQEFDIIQFEGIFIVPYLDVVKAHSKAKVIYRVHNIEHRLWERMAVLERFRPRKLYLEFLARRLHDFEVEQLSRFDGVLSISEPDRQSLVKMGCTVPLKVMPVAIDLSLYRPNLSQTTHPTLFHLGSMDWQPNREGIEWFLDEIWPDIEELNIGLRFYLAGRNMPEDLLKDDSDNLVIEEDVMDAVEFINSKSIMVVPLLSGSGMRVKIIEGMAMKKCIIATRLAAEGINCEHGKDILIADTPDEFYKSILQCVSTPGRWIDIGENARKTVEKDHDINQSVKLMLAFYRQLLS